VIHQQKKAALENVLDIVGLDSDSEEPAVHQAIFKDLHIKIG